MLMSEDFGRMKIEAIKNGFNFYQDNITISLNCKDEDRDATKVTDAQVQNMEYVKKIQFNPNLEKLSFSSL